MTRLIAVMACAAIIVFLPTMALSQGYSGYGGGYNQQSYGESMPGYAQPGAFQAYPNYNSYTNQMPSPYPAPGGGYQNYQQPTMPGGYYQQPTNPGGYYQQQQNPYASYQQQGSYRGNLDLPPGRNFQPDNGATSLVEDGVYWNGQADADDDDESRYLVPQEQHQPIAPSRRVRRPTRPSVQSTIRTPRRSPGTSVGRRTKESRSKSTSTPSRTVVQWGKKAQKAETKTSLHWGKSTKPTMVGAEPGTQKENISQQKAPSGISVQTKEATPKLQWGKKTQ